MFLPLAHSHLKSHLTPKAIPDCFLDPAVPKGRFSESGLRMHGLFPIWVHRAMSSYILGWFPLIQVLGKLQLTGFTRLSKIVKASLFTTKILDSSANMSACLMGE